MKSSLSPRFSRVKTPLAIDPTGRVESSRTRTRSQPLRTTPGRRLKVTAATLAKRTRRSSFTARTVSRRRIPRVNGTRSFLDVSRCPWRYSRAATLARPVKKATSLWMGRARTRVRATWVNRHRNVCAAREPPRRCGRIEGRNPASRLPENVRGGAAGAPRGYGTGRDGPGGGTTTRNYGDGDRRRSEVARRLAPAPPDSTGSREFECAAPTGQNGRGCTPPTRSRVPLPVNIINRKIPGPCRTQRVHANGPVLCYFSLRVPVDQRAGSG